LERKTTLPHAAFANGELINALDYDAIISVSHIPPFVLPAMLAVAEKEGATGRDLILAIAIGHEIAARIARATIGLMEVVPERPNRGIVTFPVAHGYSGAVFGALAGGGKAAETIKEEPLHAFEIAGSITPMENMPK
jgi:2-methylcitrate dehydratase PrpD